MLGDDDARRLRGGDSNKGEEQHLRIYRGGARHDEDVTKSELTMNFHTAFLHEVVLKFLKSSRDDNGDAESVRAVQPGAGLSAFNKAVGPHAQIPLKDRLTVTAHRPLDDQRRAGLFGAEGNHG